MAGKEISPHVSPASPTIATCSIIGRAGYGAIALIQRCRADLQMTEPYGARTPGDRTVIAATSRLPDNWLGLRVAIGLRRLIIMRIPDDDGLDVVRWGLRMRLHPRRNGCEKRSALHAATV